MNILFLTNLLPYPLDNGGKIKTYTTLKALSNAGHNIDLVCFKETKNPMEREENELLKVCNTIKQIYLPLTTADHKKYMIGIAAKSILSKYPFSIYKYQSKGMNIELEHKKDNSYDVIYFDHLPMCVYLANVRRLWPLAKIVLDEHNCEATITKRKSDETKNYIKRAFLKLEALKLGKFEASSILKVDKTIVLSRADYNSLARLVNQDFRHEIIPIGVPDRGIKKENNTNILNILFVGTLTWEPNNAGLVWFLKEVMPIFDNYSIDYHLYIVGKNPSEEVKGLCEAYKSRITITGYVESVDEYYDICDCTIVPLFIGSGQRVKLIEAFSKGMPAISTTIGAEGLEFQSDSIIIADDEQEFADAIKRMHNAELRRSLGKKSRQIYESNYSPQVIFEMICASVKFV